MRRARNDDGFALIAAIIVMAVILGLGAGLLLLTNGQQTASGQEQANEAAFNVAEAALNAQVGQLARKWPNPETEAERAKAGLAPEMPSECVSSTSTAENDCPSASDLKLDPNTGSTSCSGTDAWGSSHGNQWTTYVRRDKGESMVFDSTTEKGEPTYPEVPETGALWVRAVGVVQCHEVAVVTLVTRLRTKLKVPEDAIAGNWFSVTNKGKKTLVNRKGRAVEPAPISMRCERSGSKLVLEECEKYEVSKEQVSPPIGGENPTSSTTTLTPTELATLKDEAESYKTFYSAADCPRTVEELQGVALPGDTRAPVYIEGCGALQITGTEVANTEADPGFLVLANGTLELSGTSTYYGIIYAANLNPAPMSEEAIVKLQGHTLVVGGIIIDGDGGVEFGSSGQSTKNSANLEFDSLAINNLTISTGAASTRNSFRILSEGE